VPQRPVGSYVDTTGAISATPCPAGTTTTGTGATSAAACRPPTPTSNGCKKGGWRLLTDATGTPFKNQGDCVSYFATNGRNLADGRAPGKARANKKARHKARANKKARHKKARHKKEHAVRRSARRHSHRA
jgi:Tyrosine-protein kinase ephrin type A/B receptor-like